MSRHRDTISEPSEEDDVLDVGVEHTGGDANDNFSDLLYVEKLRGPKYSFQPSQATDYAFKEENVTVLRKRRKLSDPDDAARDAIDISSSPSPKDLHATNISDDEDFGVQVGRGEAAQANMQDDVDIDEQAASSPLHPPQTVMSSKFKWPAPAKFPTPTPSTRPSFKLPPSRPGPAHDEPGRQPLPDVFSPTRRRGKKDYVAGRAADTVRNWILSLAAESKAGQAYTQQVRVAEVRGDKGDGRCLLVKCEDGRRWVLLNENGGTSTTHTTDAMRKVRPGSLIGIRDSSTRMDLRIDRHDHIDLNKDSPQSTVAGDWTVGILWDVLD